MFEKIKKKVMKRPVIFGAIAVIVVIAIYIEYIK